MSELRGRACPAWSPQEDQVLRTRWTVGGYEAVRHLLPRRTYAAIATRASRLRVKAPAHVRYKPQKYTTNEHIDRAVRDGYLAATGDKAEIRRLAERVGRPRWWVSRRALELGLRQPTKREPPWTDDELELLESLSHHRINTIRRKMAARGFRRSATAIAVKVKREGIGLREARELAGIYSATGVARLQCRHSFKAHMHNGSPVGDEPRESGIAVELCAGLGGIGLGLRSLGFRIVRAYDSWDEAVAIYNHNFGHEVAVTANLLSEKGRRLVDIDRRRIGDIDLLAAGPPCKGFSQLRNGYHDGPNAHNRVLAVMPEYVALLRPRMFIIENVPDLMRHRGGRTLACVLAHLEQPVRGLRYRVEYKVYDAALFGTPQARRRILILGVRHGGKERLPEPGPNLSGLFAAVRHEGLIPHEHEPYLDALKDPENASIVSASQALSDLPPLGPGEPEARRPYASRPMTAFQRWVRTGASDALCDTRTPAVNVETLKRLHHVPPGGCARAIPKEHLNGLSRRYDSAYRRLHPDAPSTALSTKYDCVYHYSEKRSLSVREYARLQGIPDRVTFPSTVVCRRSAYEMIGNSVPPLLIERVLDVALRSGGSGE